MKKYAALFVTTTVLLLFSQAACYGFALNISPPSFKATIKPGGTNSSTITVQNNSDGNIGILAYVQDWTYNADGSKSFYAAGTTPLSCAKWIRLFPKKFQLEAKGSMGVQYTINMPEDAKGGYYAVIFFESIPVGEVEEEEGMMVRFAGRLGTIVYLETEGATIKKGDIESLFIAPPQSNKPLEMTLKFKNSGNAYINADGMLDIIDKEGNAFGKKRFGPINTLPGDTREAKVEWLGELEEGAYDAVVTLDIGTEEPIVEERKLVISSGGSVESFLVDSSSGKPSFCVSVKNTGNLNISVEGRIDILTENDELAKSLTLKKTLIAPGKKKELKDELEENLPEGTYTAKAVISLDGKEFIKEEVFFVK